MIKTILLAMLFPALLSAEDITFTCSLKEEFIISPPAGFEIVKKNATPLRVGDYKMVNKKDKIAIMLTFMCDTKDLSKMDTPDKLKFVMNEFVKKTKDGAVENPIKVNVLKPIKRFGYTAIVTDKRYVSKLPEEESEYKYWTYMAIRIGDDSVLLASVMSNNLDKFNDDAVKYCLAFEKK
jgi:hypothetical protein